MWKRKLQNFRDIFQFGDKNLEMRRRMLNPNATPTTPNPNPSPVMGKGARERHGEVNGVKFGVDSVKVDSIKVEGVK